jgi:glycogen debranching enzyme
LGNRILAAQLDAALANGGGRLPELFCGFAREGIASESPVPYPVSCSPQAWAAGAIPLMLRGALGLRVDQDAQRLIVEPRLPEWLNRVEIADLTVLGRTGSLLVERRGGDYAVTGDDWPLASRD